MQLKFTWIILWVSIGKYLILLKINYFKAINTIFLNQHVLFHLSKRNTNSIYQMSMISTLQSKLKQNDIKKKQKILSINSAL